MTTGVLLDGFVPWPSDFVERYRTEGYWRDETLGGLLRVWAARSGDATAVTAGDTVLSYAALDQRADRMAAGLLTRGIEPGDRVLVQLPNIAEFVIVFFGLIRAGAIPVLALPAHRRSEMVHLAALSEATGYVIPDHYEGFDYRELASEIAADVPSLRHILVAGDPGEHTALAAVPVPDVGPLPEADPSGVALLLMSGGTTGKPKLIPRTHRDYAYNARASSQACGLTADDVYLVCLPAAHNLPLACPGILGTLIAGGRVVLAPAPSPDVAFGLIERERVTMAAVVPPVARLWVHAAEWDRRDISSLRLLEVGGAKLDESLARRIEPALGCRLQQSFGMAEGLLTHTRSDDPHDVVATTQGLPISPADEVRVVGPEGDDVSPGEVGELWARGPYTLRGYYRVPEYNATVFTRDGFYRTGDLVRRLDSGHLVVAGRLKEMVNRGGENVSASELEDELLAHPDIALAAVVALPDEVRGEIVCAALTLSPGAARAPKLKELKAYLAERGLARFKHPDRLVVLDHLPLTGVGKVSKRALLEQIRDHS